MAKSRPCTRHRTARPAISKRSRLRSGTPTAHERSALPLLPSGPGGIRRGSLRGAQPSTPSHEAHSTRTALEREFNPAVADCGLQGTATSPSSTAKWCRLPIRAHWLRWRPRQQVQRTGSTPHLLPSGAASPLDASRQSANPTLASAAHQQKLAEGVGFEPTVELPLHGISSAAPSATRPPLHACRNDSARVKIGGGERI